MEDGSWHSTTLGGLWDSRAGPQAEAVVQVPRVQAGSGPVGMPCPRAPAGSAFAGAGLRPPGLTLP